MKTDIAEAAEEKDVIEDIATAAQNISTSSKVRMIKMGIDEKAALAKQLMEIAVLY